MRLHYNSSNFYDRDLRQDVMSGGGLCSLRARHNVDLVDMFSSTLATDWWPYTPILDGDATAAVFVVGSKAEDDRLDQWIPKNVAWWQACGSLTMGPLQQGGGNLHGFDLFPDQESGPAATALEPVGCKDSGICLWGVRHQYMESLKTLVLCAAERPRGSVAEALRRGLVMVAWKQSSECLLKLQEQI